MTISMQPAKALRLAWILWLGLLLLTFVVLLSTVYVVHGTPPSEAASVKATRWMWVLAAYFVVVVPLAFLRTGRLFRSYYRYKPVSPSNYVAGMATVWIALTLGACASLIVCLLTRTLVPNILIAAVGNVMLLALWPKGNAMAPPAGDPSDPGLYEEPR